MGKPAPRVDGPAKVTGAAKYSYDVQPDGWLYGMVLRSKWPAAKVTQIDLSKAQSMPGVKAAVLAEGEQRTVRFYGQELAAVAATTKQQCRGRPARHRGRGHAAALRREGRRRDEARRAQGLRGRTQREHAEREGRRPGRCGDGLRAATWSRPNCARRCSSIIRSRRTAAPFPSKATR